MRIKSIATLLLLFFIPLAANANFYTDSADFMGMGTGEFQNFLYLVGTPFLLFIIPFFIWLINLFRTRSSEKSPHEKYRLIRLGGTWLFTILSPFPWLFAMIINAILKPKWQKQQNEIDKLRLVNANGKPYRLMTEEEEDQAFLEKKLEVEVVKSDKYDVWVDEETSEFFIEETLNWHPWRRQRVGKYKGYTACPNCSKKSLTPWSFKSYVHRLGGMINPFRKRHMSWTKNCTSCSYHKTKKFTYYVLRWPFQSTGTYSNQQRSNSRSVSDYMGKNIFSSGSGSSSSSSSNSNSGSSYGGGQSGGGGSTGGW